MPSKTCLDSYKCRHGLGYSVFESKKNSVSAKLTAFVPVGENCEINKLTLTNESTAAKELSIFSYVEFCLWNAMDDMTNFQRNYSTGEVEVHGPAIFHKTEYRERRNHYAVYAVNTAIDGFDTDRDSFLGAYGENSAPECVLKDESKLNRQRMGTDRLPSCQNIFSSRRVQNLCVPTGVYRKSRRRKMGRASGRRQDQSETRKRNDIEI